MDFGQWRSLVHAPSPESWQTLCAALTDEPLTPLFYQELLPYLDDQLMRWPQGLRLLKQLAPYKLKPAHPLWRLSEGMESSLLWHDLKDFNTVCAHWGEQLHIERLGLEGQETLGSWRAHIERAPWLARLEHLYIEQSYELSALGLILAQPGLDKLKSLTITCDDREPSCVDCGLTTLAPLHSSSLEAIFLGEHPIHPRELTGLRAAQLPKLRQLGLVVCEDGGLEALCGASWLGGLAHLELTLTREASPAAHDIAAWRSSRGSPSSVYDDGHITRALDDLLKFLRAPDLAKLERLMVDASSAELEHELVGALADDPTLLPSLKERWRVGLSKRLPLSPHAQELEARRPALSLDFGISQLFTRQAQVRWRWRDRAP